MLFPNLSYETFLSSTNSLSLECIVFIWWLHCSSHTPSMDAILAMFYLMSTKRLYLSYLEYIILYLCLYR